MSLENSQSGRVLFEPFHSIQLALTIHLSSLVVVEKELNIQNISSGFLSFCVAVSLNHFNNSWVVHYQSAFVWRWTFGPGPCNCNVMSSCLY